MKGSIWSASALLVLASAWSVTTAQEKIDFEGLAAGTIVHQVLTDMGHGPVYINGANPLIPGDNAAVIFNSAAPTGGDCDLGTPHLNFGGPGCGRKPAAMAPYANNIALHNILILDTDLDPLDDQTGLVTDPDDLDCSDMFDAECGLIPEASASIRFDFSEFGAVTLESLRIVDADGAGPDPRVEMFDDGGALLNIVAIPTDIPNNGVALVDLGGTAGVVTLIVFLQGSGAMDDLTFTPEEQPACGDGVVDDGEACDDGNTVSGDGCSSDCQLEDDEDDDEVPDDPDDENDDETDDGHFSWWWHG